MLPKRPIRLKRVYQSLEFTGTPGLIDFYRGNHPIYSQHPFGDIRSAWVYGGVLADDGSVKPQVMDPMLQQCLANGNGPLSCDIEGTLSPWAQYYWGLCGFGPIPSQEELEGVRTAIRNLVAYRDAHAPDVPIGFYVIYIDPNVYNFAGRRENMLTQMRRLHQAWTGSELVDDPLGVDFFMLELYPRAQAEEDEMMARLRRAVRDIRPILCAHGERLLTNVTWSRFGTMRGKALSGAAMRKVAGWCLRNTDGMVLYGGWGVSGRAMYWDLVAPAPVEAWQEVTDGAIWFTLAGCPYLLQDMDFSAVASLADVAAVLQAAYEAADAATPWGSPELPLRPGDLTFSAVGNRIRVTIDLDPANTTAPPDSPGGRTYMEFGRAWVGTELYPGMTGAAEPGVDWGQYHPVTGPRSTWPAWGAHRPWLLSAAAAAARATRRRGRRSMRRRRR